MAEKVPMESPPNELSAGANDLKQILGVFEGDVAASKYDLVGA